MRLTRWVPLLLLDTTTVDKLGHSLTSSVSVPKLVRGIGGPNQRVKIVSCSYYHTVVVCDDGMAHSFGRNDFGQLGLGDATDRGEPTRIESSAEAYHHICCMWAVPHGVCS